MSAVRPRPVGPTMRGKGSVATMPSRPRSRRQVSPKETISIGEIVAADDRSAGQKETRGACPIGAPRSEGGRGNVEAMLRGSADQKIGRLREATRRQTVKKQTSIDLVHNSAMTPITVTFGRRPFAGALVLALVPSAAPRSRRHRAWPDRHAADSDRPRHRPTPPASAPTHGRPADSRRRRPTPQRALPVDVTPTRTSVGPGTPAPIDRSRRRRADRRRRRAGAADPRAPADQGRAVPGDQSRRLQELPDRRRPTRTRRPNGARPRSAS